MWWYTWSRETCFKLPFSSMMACLAMADIFILRVYHKCTQKPQNASGGGSDKRLSGTG